MDKFQVLLLSLQILAFLATSSAIGQQISSNQDVVSGNSLKFQSFREILMLMAKKRTLSLTFKVDEAGDLMGKSMDALESPDVKKDLCARHDIDGCSIPFGWSAPYKKQFTPSCNRHDVCYRCGVSYDINRLKCDDAFFYDMERTCYANLIEADRKMMESVLREKYVPLNAIMTKAMNDMARESGDLLGVVLGSDLVEEALRKKIVVEWLVFLSQFLKHDDEHVVEIESNHQEVSQECVQLLEAADEISLSAHGYRVSHVVTCKQVKAFGCVAATYAYYRAVRTFGSSSYHTKPENYCSEPFVTKCLPKKIKDVGFLDSFIFQEKPDH